MIEVMRLVKRFGGVVAVDDISLAVRPGEIFGFLGPNGAGKTTTINILCTLLRPTSGQARVAGYDVTTQSRHVRQAIGIIFQDPSLDERLTAEENLEFHGLIYHVPRQTRRRHVDALLRLVQLEDRRHDVVRTFSGGMKRRLEIARGFIHEPQILFLDEPTQGLDPQTRTNIWAYIEHLRTQRPVTIFMTTHYMDEAEHCDRIAIIDHGRIIALDTPEALKRQVGGDVITLTTADDRLAAEEIARHFGLTAHANGAGLRLDVPDGHAFLPRLLLQCRVPITTVDLRRPTLDDVFLKLTGRAIREGVSSTTDRLRETKRRFTWKAGRR